MCVHFPSLLKWEIHNYSGEWIREHSQNDFLQKRLEYNFLETWTLLRKGSKWLISRNLLLIPPTPQYFLMIILAFLGSPTCSPEAQQWLQIFSEAFVVLRKSFENLSALICVYPFPLHECPLLFNLTSKHSPS